MQLKKGTALRGGEFVIEKVLGQGGFGITYLAVQTGLNRKVAVKEFFMKEHCNRDSDTSHVSVPSLGSREQVARFKAKFVKEAQTIAALNHPNIIRIISVFEENETAYYVMDYVEGGSLEGMSAPDAPMQEFMAKKYISQIAEALRYLHGRNILHLDIKPSNILVNDGNAVLIDFGVSKRYDSSDGSQTSTSPVGISEGYAPLEQYKRDGVARFSPATDIYSLAATLYKLVTGRKPLSASELVTMRDGLEIPGHVSHNMAEAIRKAMRPVIDERPQSVTAFMDMMKDGDTVIVPPVPAPVPPARSAQPVKPVQPAKKGRSFKWLFILLLAGLIGAGGWWGYGMYKEKQNEDRFAGYMQNVADALDDSDEDAALDYFIEFNDWYETLSSEEQLKIDEYMEEWFEAHLYECNLIDEWLNEQDWSDEEVASDGSDSDWSDILSDPDVQEFALGLLEELF